MLWELGLSLSWASWQVRNALQELEALCEGAAAADDDDTGGNLAQKPSRWGLLCVSVRADATNSSIWKREKLHVLDTDVAIVANEMAARNYDGHNAFRAKRCLSDLQVVCGSDASSCNGMVLKQLRSVGVPTWQDVAEEMDRPDSKLSSASVFLYLDVSDRGSDQAARKRRTKAALEARDNIVYISSDCFLHHFHNAVKNGLELVDHMIEEFFTADVLNGFKNYWSSVAKVAHVWRDKAADIMRQWEEIHAGADEDTRKLGVRYPMTVVAGRWGSIESCEDYLLARGRALVEPVLVRALAKHMKADVAQSAEGHVLFCRWAARRFTMWVSKSRVLSSGQLSLGFRFDLIFSLVGVAVARTSRTGLTIPWIWLGFRSIEHVSG